MNKENITAEEYGRALREGRPAKIVPAAQVARDVLKIINGKLSCNHDMRPMYKSGEFITGARCSKCGYTEWL